MPDTLREIFLNQDEQPNANALRLQDALNETGCLCVNRPGGKCRANVIFYAPEFQIICTEKAEHNKYGYDAPYGQVVMNTIKEIEREAGRRKLVQLLSVPPDEAKPANGQDDPDGSDDSNRFAGRKRARSPEV